ncbi:hypothetical protein HDC36_003789 [Xanthomonas sp. JAI131]|uniref:hypothetical protein n=1 Tax=Xanthomonas sp. JAI131 TaxID=2723067 RepID=UPI0017A8B1A6|nr:hypothetical protein [Xanthomonas sp. JAI131]NYF22313.1 hypothetical protein [Xanthomonas sp. JAI131]
MKEKFSRSALAMAATGLAIMCALIYYRPQSKNIVQQVAAQRQNPPESSAASVSRSQERTQLPPEDTPFRLIADSLRIRALKGDADAACRLALEYQKCELTRQQVNHADDVLSQNHSGSEEVPDIALPLDQSKFYSNVAHCEGAEEVGAGEISRMWRRSAENGNLAAMVNYAAGNAFSVASTLDSAEELIAYRKIAPQISQAAINRGSGMALLSLAAAYQPENQIGFRSYLAQAVKADVQESLTLYKMAKIAAVDGDGQVIRFVDEQIERLDKRASPLQRTESDREARERANAIGRIQLPSSQAIAWLRTGSAPGIQVKDCAN